MALFIYYGYDLRLLFNIAFKPLNTVESYKINILYVFSLPIYGLKCRSEISFIHSNLIWTTAFNISMLE